MKWSDVAPFTSFGEQAGRERLQVIGKKIIEDLNVVLKETASSWIDKVKNNNSYGFS